MFPGTSVDWPTSGRRIPIYTALLSDRRTFPSTASIKKCELCEGEYHRWSQSANHDFLAQCPQILLCSPGSGTAGESEEGVDLLGTVPMFPDLVSNGRWDIFNLPPEISDWTHIYNIIEGSLEVKLSTIWTDEKQSREDAERRERLEERRRVRRKKMQMREKVGKSRNTVFFQWFGAPEGRKVGSLKRRVRSQLARWEMKNCTPLWREAHFQVKMYKTHQVRTTFGSWDVEKVHAVVARSTFPSQNAQNTPGADHFWQLRCRKSARRCDAKHISKSKCTKHTRCGALLEVEMSKKCTPLWREAHFQVKMYKTHSGADHFWQLTMSKKCTPLWREAHFEVKMCNAPQCRTTFGGSDLEKCTPLWREAHLEVKMLKTLGVRTTFGSPDLEKVHAVVVRSTFGSQNVKNTWGSDHFGGSDVASLRFGSLHYTIHSTTLHYSTLHYTTLHNTTTTQLHNYTTTLHYTPLHSTTLNYTTLHHITLHSNTLHYTTLHYTTLHYTTLPSTTLHYITPHYTPLHYNYNYDYTTTLHYTPLH